MSSSSISCRCDNILLELEPIDLEDRVGSVNLNIRLSFMAVRQTLNWSTQAWVLYTALDDFEQALLAGCNATLVDMSSYPVLQIKMQDQQAVVTINPAATRQSEDGEKLTIKVKAGPLLLKELAQAFRTYPRWW